MKLVITEKPSVAMALASVLGARTRKDGYVEGNGYIVSWCVGHLVGLCDASEYDEKYKKWRYEDLPIVPECWKHKILEGTKKQFGILKKLMRDSEVNEVICATDLEQREGRIIRQGNHNKKVHIFRYVTESTFDSYMWQLIENKQKFISQIMTSKSPVRSCDDVDETALSFAEIKALCAGDPRIKERMDLDVEVSRLKLMKADHQSKQYRLEDQLLKYFPEEIEKHKGFIKGFESDLEVLAAHPHPEDGFAGMEIRGDLLTDKENAGAALLDACKEVKTSDPVQIGSYRGYAMSVEFSAWKQEYTLLLKGQMTHRATLGTDPRGNLTRIDNALAQMSQRLEAAKAQLDNLYQQQAAAKEEVGKPFLYEEELRSKNARLVELDTLLNIDGKGQAHAEAVVDKSTRTSVLDSLKRPVPPRSLEKKPKQHEEVR